MEAGSKQMEPALSYFTDELVTALAATIACAGGDSTALDALCRETSDLTRALSTETRTSLSRLNLDDATNPEIVDVILSGLLSWAGYLADQHGSLRRYVVRSLEKPRSHFLFTRTDFPELLLAVAPIGSAFTHDPGRAFDIARHVIHMVEDDIEAAVSAGTIAMLTAYLARDKDVTQAVDRTLEFLDALNGDDLVAFELRHMLDTIGIECFSPAMSTGGLVAAVVRRVTMTCGQQN